MTGEQFIAWLDTAKRDGLIRSDADASRLLRVSANTIVSLKRNGADYRTQLACMALLKRLHVDHVI